MRFIKEDAGNRYISKLSLPNIETSLFVRNTEDGKEEWKITVDSYKEILEINRKGDNCDIQ